MTIIAERYKYHKYSSTYVEQLLNSNPLSFEQYQYTHPNTVMAFFRSKTNMAKLNDHPDKICKLLADHPRLLEFVDDQTEQMCTIALSSHWAYFDHVKAQTPSVCYIAVAHSGHNVSKVKNQTQELCDLSVFHGLASNIMYVINQTYEQCMFAVKHSADNFQYIKDEKHKTFELCLAALRRGQAQISKESHHTRKRFDQLVVNQIPEQIIQDCKFVLDAKDSLH